MANELIAQFESVKTVYFTIRNTIGQIWSTVAGSFGAYSTAAYADYDVAATEQGTASGIYAANFPAAIVPGLYYIVAYQQLGGAVAETDRFVAQGSFNWDGTFAMPLTNVATSGQLSQFMPVKMARSWMVQNYKFYLRSAADHVTPFTSGVVSGQILRDGGSWGALESGAFTEKGLGWYSLQALTSGDLAAASVALQFSAVGISGGSADPLPISILLQKVSGSV